MNYVQLREMCCITMGQSPNSDSYNEEREGVPFFQGNADFGERYPSVRTWCKEPKKMAKNGDVLISVRAPIGAINYARETCCIGRGLAALSPKTDKVSKEFIFWVMKSRCKELQMKGTGSTFKAISKKILEEVKIPLYPLEKQIEYSLVLEKVYAIIETYKSELQKLDELIQARFVEMFGDIDVNPLGWDTYNLDECFEIASSKRILKSEWKTEGIPFLRVRDVVQLVTTGKIDNDFFVSEEFYATLKDSDGIPKQGDVLVSATSTLGKCYIVKSGERFYFKDADVLRFRSKKNINPVFFVEQMKTQYIEKQIARTLGVTTVAHFTIKAAKTINMRLPDIELQNQFAAFVNQVNKSKVEIQKALEKTQLLFDSLMQQYFG